MQGEGVAHLRLACRRLDAVLETQVDAETIQESYTRLQDTLNAFKLQSQGAA